MLVRQHRAQFHVLVDGRLVGNESLKAQAPGQSVERKYSLPPDLLAGKARVTVRLQAKVGSTAGELFGARIVRR